jgi:hypothetical protein
MTILASNALARTEATPDEEYRELLEPYLWAFALLDRARVPYMKTTSLEDGGGTCVAVTHQLPDAVSHEDLFLLRGADDLNHRLDREAVVRRWGDELKRKVGNTGSALL